MPVNEAMFTGTAASLASGLFLTDGTSITLQMYCKRKGWDLGRIEVKGPDAAMFLHNLCTNDVKNLAHPVLEHRLSFRPEAQMRGVTANEVVGALLDGLKVPVARSGR